MWFNYLSLQPLPCLPPFPRHGSPPIAAKYSQIRICICVFMYVCMYIPNIKCKLYTCISDLCPFKQYFQPCSAQEWRTLNVVREEADYRYASHLKKQIKRLRQRADKDAKLAFLDAVNFRNPYSPYALPNLIVCHISIMVRICRFFSDIVVIWYLNYIC